MQSGRRTGDSLVGVEPLAHFLAGLEIGHALRRYVDRIAGARIAPKAGFTQPGRERPKASQLDPAALGQTSSDFIEEDIDDLLDLFRPKFGVVGGKRLPEFGSDHRLSYPSGGHFGPASFTSPLGDSECGSRDPLDNLAE